jgi:hypothetical protein
VNKNTNIFRWVKFYGKWRKAEECTHKQINEPYYMICGHIIPRDELDEIGDIITSRN